jgi:preprotein translocase SecE subunit
VSEAVAHAPEKNKEGIGVFIKETRAELDKTTFPDREEVRNTTLVVIASVIFFGVYLFVADYIWVYLLDGLTWPINRIAGI